ncbi:MAG TPA: class I SAM-dependent methyltransferase [Myxococcota bacterium]|nr:class I SAM-dependent methyltransferase [Myxococcota bacterium]
MAAPELDPEKLQGFGAKLLGALNGAAVALMTSLGHRTGLFDVMSRLPPATSRRIADEAGLDERYVREWLGAMVTSAVVEYDPARSHYSLPPEHAALLTREAEPDNLAATFQWIPLLASVEDRVLECFERGGNVSYLANPRFRAVKEEESDRVVVGQLVEDILPLVPGLPDALARGIDALDVACGSGRALNLLAGEFPRSRFTGYDLSVDAIEGARAEARDLRLGNVRFAVRDPGELEQREAFDLVTAFYAIHDQTRPEAVLRGIAQALRPDGVFLMQEVAATSRVDEDSANPLSPFLYTVSCLHGLTVSLAEGGEGLGLMWGSERALAMLEAAGFGRVVLRRLPRDRVNLYYVARK